MKRQNLLKEIMAKPDWSKPVAAVAKELGISRASAYRLRDSFRKKHRGPRYDLEAEVLWTLDTLNRCARVEAETRKHFGKLIKRWRKDRKVTQKVLAVAAFGSENRHTNICDYELGDKPSRKAVEKIAAVMLSQSSTERSEHKP